MSDTVALNVGDPNAHVHDWVSFGPADGFENDNDPIQKLACNGDGCEEVGYGRGDFSAAAREDRLNHKPSVWTSAGPPGPDGLHPIKDQYGNTNTCDCLKPNDEGVVTPDPGHEVTA